MCKNEDIIFAQGVTAKFKIIYSDSENQYIKERMNNLLVIELKKDYFIIDFENLPDLEKSQFEMLKEENFEELNEYYYYLKNNILECKIKEGNYARVPSKLTVMSSVHDGIDIHELSIIEVALLGADDVKIGLNYPSRSQSVQISMNEQIFFNTDFDENASMDYDKVGPSQNLLMQQAHDDDKLIMMQGFAIVIDIESTNINFLLWKIDKELAQEIEYVINTKMDWYIAKFESFLQEIFKYFDKNFHIDLNEQIEKYTGSLEKNESEGSEERNQDFESDTSKANPTLNTLNMINDTALSAFRRKKKDEYEHKWEELSKNKLLRSLTAEVEEANFEEKHIYALSLIKMLQEDHEPNDINYYQELKDNLRFYIENYLKVLVPKSHIFDESSTKTIAYNG